MKQRVHTSVPPGQSHGVSAHVPRHTSTPRAPIPKAIKDLLGDMSRTELAAKAKLSAATISLTFGGQRNPKASTIRAIARALGKTMEQVMLALERAAASRAGLEDARGLLSRVQRGGLDADD